MHLSNEESLSRMTASSTYALGEWQESEVIILRELQGAVASGQDDYSSDRIGEETINETNADIILNRPWF